MSALSSLSSAAARRRSVCIFLILLVVCITIYTVEVKSSSAILMLFSPDGRTALKYSGTNDNPKQPGRQNETAAPPPEVQHNVKPKREEQPTASPPPSRGLEVEDGLLQGKSQKEGAGNTSDDGLLERGNQNLTETCQPKSHVVFLKTHKTASSTVQNILYRYGEGRGLTFALPRGGGHMLSYPRYFDTNFVEKKGRTHFDILCNHMRFKKSEVKKLMPEDSFYFSILRHPVPAMESTFWFFKYIENFRRFRTLDDFLDNGQNNKSVKDHYAHNSFAFDLGYNNTATADTADVETIVSKVIDGIEQDFHLILITEYFEESMILLKHALCWSLEDVVSFKVNSRSSKSHTSVSNTSAEKIERWNVLDWRIYTHFNDTFWHKVRSLVGEEEMKLEVSRLKELQAKLSSTCLEGGHAVNEKEVKDKTVKPHHGGSTVIQGYNLNPNLDIQTKEKCQRMVIPEDHRKVCGLELLTERRPGLLELHNQS